MIQLGATKVVRQICLCICSRDAASFKHCADILDEQQSEPCQPPSDNLLTSGYAETVLRNLVYTSPEGGAFYTTDNRSS